jgi:hypothetical protein
MNTVKKLIDTYPEWEGSKILETLLHNPDLPIQSSTLEHAVAFKLSPVEAEATIYHHPPIAMTDYATLQAVDKRLKKLILLKAEYLSQQQCGNSPYDAEIKALVRYRKESTNLNGAPKSFPDEDRKAYCRQAAAIRRLLARAEQDGHHEAVAIVKRQLSLGRQAQYNSRS